MVVLRTTFSYIRGSDSHISLENIVTVRYIYIVEGLLSR